MRAVYKVLVSSLLLAGVITAAPIEIFKAAAYVHANGSLLTVLDNSSPVFFSTLDANNLGTFGWVFTNTTGSTLTNVKMFGFLDADIDTPINTYFNEYGAFLNLSLPPGALPGSVAATSWQIDEPGFVFGTIINDLAAGVLLNQNFVPSAAPDDVSFALGFSIGSLAPGQSVKVTFVNSLSNIGGLQQIDPDSNYSFYFNGYATVSALPPQPPALTKSFGTASISVGDSTTLNFTISNPNSGQALNGIAFTDPLPAGISVGVPSGLLSDCAGTITAAGAVVTVTSVSLPPATSCTVTVTVSGAAPGVQNNLTSGITSGNGGSGAPATASITVTPAATPPDAFQIRYASNLNIADSFINISNSGSSSTPASTPSGNLCINMYAFSADEQLVSCCSCFLPPNGLVSLSVRNDVISNTLTPSSPPSVVLNLISTAAGPDSSSCNPATVGTGGNTLASGMRAWGTTIHAISQAGSNATAYGTTETPFSAAPLSQSELLHHTSFCEFIQATGSGFGICKSCRGGGAGAAQR